MRRAFSLLETLIAAFTLGLALTMVVLLIQQYLRLMKQSDGSLQRVAPRLALLEVAEEARLALDFNSVSSSVLTFQRLRPATDPIVGTDPWPASRRMTVSYQLQNEELWRSWQWTGQASQRELVAAPVKTFRITKNNSRTLVIKLNDFEETVHPWHD